MAGVKLSMTFAEKTFKMLEELSGEKGITKSAIVSLAVDKYYKNEKGESSDKK